MLSAAFKKRLTNALAGAALASALAVSGASAAPAEQMIPRTTGDTPEVAPPPSSIAESAAEEYEKLRAQAADNPAPEPQPVADEPSGQGGFDFMSAAIGAVVAGAMSLVLMASLGMRRPTSRGAASA
jgi:hypothetical protein